MVCVLMRVCVLVSVDCVCFSTVLLGGSWFVCVDVLGVCCVCCCRVFGGLVGVGFIW